MAAQAPALWEGRWQGAREVATAVVAADQGAEETVFVV